MGGSDVTLFGMELDAVSSLLIVFFLLWVLWGLIQYGLKKVLDERPGESDNEGR